MCLGKSRFTLIITKQKKGKHESLDAGRLRVAGKTAKLYDGNADIEENRDKSNYEEFFLPVLFVKDLIDETQKTWIRPMEN